MIDEVADLLSITELESTLAKVYRQLAEGLIVLLQHYKWAQAPMELHSQGVKSLAEPPSDRCTYNIAWQTIIIKSTTNYNLFDDIW